MTMPQEEAKGLIERMDTDESFREKVLAAPDVAARLRLAAAEGNDVTEEEIESAWVALSDEDLSGAAGGADGRAGNAFPTAVNC